MSRRTRLIKGVDEAVAELDSQLTPALTMYPSGFWMNGSNHKIDLKPQLAGNETSDIDDSDLYRLDVNTLLVGSVASQWVKAIFGVFWDPEYKSVVDVMHIGIINGKVEFFQTSALDEPDLIASLVSLDMVNLRVQNLNLNPLPE